MSDNQTFPPSASQPANETTADLPESPLAGVSSDTITELFAREPLSWNDTDMRRMVEHLRAKRLTMASNQAPEKKTRAKPAKIALEGKSGLDLLAGLGLAKS